MNDMIKYTTDRGEVELSSSIIRKYLVPADTQVTDQEVGLFLELCRYQKLNPFVREAYLVKYGGAPASIVTSKEVFTQRAQSEERFAGHEAGVTVRVGDKITRREGSLTFKGEQLVGGWAKVYIKGYSVPIFDEVSLAEYEGRKKDGTLTKMWAEKPGTMIRKVALVHALREAFPDKFKGLYSQEEINTIDPSALPTETIKINDADANDPDVVPDVYADVLADAKDVTPQDIPLPEPPPVPNTHTAQSVRPAQAAKPQEFADAGFIVPLGKHKGSTMEHVYESDKGWLEWYLTWEKARDPMLSAVRRYLNAKDNEDQMGMDEPPMPTEDDCALPWDLDGLAKK